MRVTRLYAFLVAFLVGYAMVLNILRARLHRPTLLEQLNAEHLSIEHGFDVAHLDISTPQGSAESSIFVSVASYRDPLCAATIRGLFSQSAYPFRVVTGIVEQHYSEDRPCIAHPSRDSDRHRVVIPHPNVRLLRVPPSEAKGPIHTRYYAASMYRHEDYFMMVDSHCKLARDWDLLLIRMQFEATAMLPLSSRGAILTYHPPAWVLDDETPSDVAPLIVDRGGALLPPMKMPVVCRPVYDYPELGYPVLYSVPVKRTSRPRPSPFIGAGLVFAPGSVLQYAPFDPYLPYIFHGEEILLSARYWTSGFDFFAPHVDVVFHYYYRREAPKYFNRTSYDVSMSAHEQELATLRVQLLLQSTVYVMRSRREGKPLRMYAENISDERVVRDLDVFGLGKDRTLDQFWHHVGIDPLERRSTTERLWNCS
jgi:hypothetical protein